MTEFGVAALEHFVADFISTTDMSCFTTIVGKFIYIKCKLFPFPLLYSHSHPITIISHLAITPMFTSTVRQLSLWNRSAINIRPKEMHVLPVAVCEKVGTGIYVCFYFM